MDPDHKEKTAFTSYEGLYQFKYLSFVVCNTVTTFERLMEFVLRGLHWKMCILYIDDIIVFAERQFSLCDPGPSEPDKHQNLVLYC
jgi:hypothetical protein